MEFKGSVANLSKLVTLFRGQGRGVWKQGEGKIQQRTNWPKRFTQCSHGCRGIEDQLGSIEAVHHPIHWEMTAVTNVDGNFSVFGNKHFMSGVPLHIVSGFVKVTNPIKIRSFWMNENILTNTYVRGFLYLGM